LETITSGSITAFYLFDVSESIDLTALRTLIGGGAEAARLVPKAGTPSYFKYAVPPVVADGEAVGIGEIDGFRTRLKFFDYGVVSLALTRVFRGTWQVFSITGLEPHVTAEALVAGRSAEIALLLRGERQPLSSQEQEEVLRSRLSYLVDDLVVPTWNAKLVYDAEAGAGGARDLPVRKPPAAGVPLLRRAARCRARAHLLPAAAEATVPRA
jgi:hypothetical protein